MKKAFAFVGLALAAALLVPASSQTANTSVAPSSATLAINHDIPIMPPVTAYIVRTPGPGDDQLAYIVRGKKKVAGSETAYIVRGKKHGVVGTGEEATTAYIVRTPGPGEDELAYIVRTPGPGEDELAYIVRHPGPGKGHLA
ncbi:hypothetical protein [Tumebacillus permanentifrigoris]|uniref:Uncharacterized protein n=1 Tax=Tumebacillus permanentifrigoris TaxID=378543 RepID=A0A316D420_9BACL|nr:hypothetical protein [Tumebacillus permanentifrigoris]PWK05950.1 hypothetical protein C7459_12112 [Tumebacillus permanentifrigoris]